MPPATARVLVLFDTPEGVRLLVQPDLRTVTDGEDLDFLESMLRDLQASARISPDGTFDAICSLGIGPLMIQGIGRDIQNEPKMARLLTQFVLT